MDTGKKRAMPYLMTNSVVPLRKGAEFLIIIILVVSAELEVQEMNLWKQRCSKSL